MIIFGWRTRSSVSHVEHGNCPVCQIDRDIAFQVSKLWFTLFFLPIFPIKTTRYDRVCSHCGSIFPTNVPGAGSLTSSLNSDGPAQPVRQTSPSAIVALVLACLSPVLICLCYSSIPASIAAIVLGHLSLNAIAKADGRLDGRGLSIASLTLAYPVLLLSLGLMSYSLVLVVQRNTSLPNASLEASSVDPDGLTMGADADAQTRFDEAERQILALQGDSPGRGNNPEAVRLAEAFAEMMLEVRESAFTNGKKPLFQLSSGQFITYVELHADRALFLVHVPEYRKFSGEAKEQLAQLAWTVAQLTVQEVLPEDAQLAVALKGTVMYGDIMTGFVSKYEGLRDNYVNKKKSDLLAYFLKQPSEPKPSEPQVEAALDSTLVELPESKDIVQAPAPTASVPPVRKTRERFEFFEPKLSITSKVKIPRVSWQYESMAWSHQGKWLAAGKIDDTLTLFDAGSGQIISEVKKLAGLDYFTALTFSFDDRFLLAATSVGETALLQVDPQGKLQYVGAMYRHAKGSHVLASSPRYPFAASGGKDGTIAWQTLAIPSQTKLLQYLKREPLAIWLPTEGTQALALNGDTLLRFSLRDASVLAEQPVGLRSAKGACFSPDGSQCVLVNYQDIYWSECGDRMAAVSIYNAKPDSLSSVVFHPNNRWIAVSGRGNVLILDVVQREPLARFVFDSTGSIKCLQFSPDGRQLAVSFQSTDANIQLLEIQEL